MRIVADLRILDGVRLTGSSALLFTYFSDTHSRVIPEFATNTVEEVGTVTYTNDSAVVTFQ